jgi:hypothetical protein
VIFGGGWPELLLVASFQLGVGDLPSDDMFLVDLSLAFDDFHSVIWLTDCD